MCDPASRSSTGQDIAHLFLGPCWPETSPTFQAAVRCAQLPYSGATDSKRCFQPPAVAHGPRGLEPSSCTLREGSGAYCAETQPGQCNLLPSAAQPTGVVDIGEHHSRNKGKPWLQPRWRSCTFKCSPSCPSASSEGGDQTQLPSPVSWPCGGRG